MPSSIRPIACFCVCLLLVCSLVAMPVAAAGSTGPTPEPDSAQTALTDPTATPESTAPTAEPIDDLGEHDTVVVRLEEADVADADVTGSFVSATQHHAATTQAALREYVASRPSLSVERRFWITNAVVLAVGDDPPPVAELRNVDHVASIHRNVVVEMARSTPAGSPTPEPATPSVAPDLTATAATGPATHGVARVGAPTAWNRSGTRGEGVRIAVLDTGVDPDHPDLSIDAGNWAAFDQNGTATNATPHDDNGHGTHVSGSVVGGNASGEWIGTAPDATLLHAKVLNETGIGTFAQFVAGLQWAVEADADVVVMSFGTQQKAAPFIAPIATAEEEGIPVVAAVGNGGANTSSSPGNVHESIAVGAVNGTDAVASFSGGETIETSTDWEDPPDDWPDRYTVPDVVAPGVNVKSSAVGGGYRRSSGTSMATPYVGGSLAVLLASTNATLTPGHLRERITTTADPPPEGTAAREDRYGAGIVNATGLVVAPNRPVGSVRYPPRDLDGDGRYEDVNGNGEVTIVDVSAFFKGYRGQTVRENPDAFDFNDDGRITIVDVSRLFISLR